MNRGDANIKSTFVISDLHLGAPYSYHSDVAEFLKWLGQAEDKPEPQTINYNNQTITLQPPGKLILLGDIIELWEPIDNEFKNTAKHFFESLQPLLRLECEIIYVTGNHDEAIESFTGTYPLTTPSLTIHKRHYPEPDKPLQIGDHTYFFLHGHQFDKLFRIAKSLSHLPSLVAMLFSITRRIFPPDGMMSIPALIISLLLLLITNTAATPNSTIKIIQSLLTILTSGIFILALSKIWTDIQNRASKTIRQNTDIPKYKTVNQIIEEQYYDEDKAQGIKANTIVYGHTHKPEISHQPALKKTFINTGSWANDELPQPSKTILYLHENHHILLQWNSEKKTIEPMREY